MLQSHLPSRSALPKAQVTARHAAKNRRCNVVSRPSLMGGAADGVVATDAAPAAAAAAAAAAPDAAAASALVDSVLADAAGTDGGVAAAPAVRERIDQALDALAAAGREQRPRPLDNDLLWGNYEVAYTSIARAAAAQQRGQPAGGRFRSRAGRFLFRTTGVFQSVLRPDVATNKVAFKLLGLIPGYIALRGRIEPLPEDPDGRATVRVLFDRPVLSLGGALTVRIGPPSRVQLTTTYLDERVRLGRGSRGSLFVFARSAAADAAEMDRVGLECSTPAGKALLALALLGLIAAGWRLFSAGAPALQIAGAGVWLVAAGIALVFRSGGVEDGPDAGWGDAAAKTSAGSSGQPQPQG